MLKPQNEEPVSISANTGQKLPHPIHPRRENRRGNQGDKWEIWTFKYEASNPMSVPALITYPERPIQGDYYNNLIHQPVD
jgi:hypothetical protein